MPPVQKKARLDRGDGADAEAPATEVIHPDGDIVFVVGAKQKQVLVHSAVLTTASEVFSALLSDRFHEGQQHRSAGSPAMIPLPDDDEDATIQMLCLLHPGPSYDLVDFWPAQLFRLASVIDKYCCKYALDLQVEALLLRLYKTWKKDRTGWHNDLGALATAAYMLEQSSCFQMFTAELVLVYPSSYSALSRPDITPGAKLPVNALLALEEIRGSLRLLLQSDLEAKAVEHLDARRDTSPNGSVASRTDVLFHQGISQWPPAWYTESSLSLWEILDCVQNPEGPSRQCPCGRHCEGVTQLQVAAKAFEESFKGLCLKCVREDTIDNADLLDQCAWRFTPPREDACRNKEHAG
ncbi:uncharacterized protein RCC_02107 [Ramularia collo-cygni]|uniref:BTB domain-containing protein n=1 Tax=Ramularia collo-cygni TaxID=112498 RepID=A0A2D3URQ9_9PEZI|nr:uncharacterized protein RCC_02107 [Ramularia collo-cygni]CZT16265.1 uncharacterized protein RCC_02107 [Ramularia collo-cygni]